MIRRRFVLYGRTVRDAARRATAHGIDPARRDVILVTDAGARTALIGTVPEWLDYPDGNEVQIACMCQRPIAFRPPAARRLTDGTMAAIGVKILALGLRMRNQKVARSYYAEAAAALAPRRFP